MNWYKEAKLSADLKKQLNEAPESLRNNIFFMAGVDSKKYPKGYRELEKLTGDEYNEAKRYINLGWHWKEKRTNPEYAKKIEEKILKEKEMREMREKDNKFEQSIGYTGDPSVKTLQQHYNNPSRSGWWDSETYEKNTPY